MDKWKAIVNMVMILCSIKCRKFLDLQLLASQEGLCTMEVVCVCVGGGGGGAVVGNFCTQIVLCRVLTVYAAFYHRRSTIIWDTVRGAQNCKQWMQALHTIHRWSVTCSECSHDFLPPGGAEGGMRHQHSWLRISLFVALCESILLGKKRSAKKASTNVTA
jgi:hypothetical protein